MPSDICVDLERVFLTDHQGLASGTGKHNSLLRVADLSPGSGNKKRGYVDNNLPLLNWGNQKVIIPFQFKNTRKEFD
jgi:hypothetical protein